MLITHGLSKHTVVNRIVQYLQSVHLLKHLPMALFGASSLQSSAVQYCSWGGRCLHNTGTCCKPLCNNAWDTCLALCIFYLYCSSTVRGLRLSLLNYGEKEVRETQSSEQLNPDWRWTAARKQKKTGIIDSSKDESANSDGVGDISIRPTDSLLCQDTHTHTAPLHSLHSKLKRSKNHSRSSLLKINWLINKSVNVPPLQHCLGSLPLSLPHTHTLTCT